MATPPTAPDLTQADARQLATDVFLRGFPLALMDAVRRSHPITSERFLRLPASAADLAGGLNHGDACCLQSSAVADLGRGPAVLHLPDMRGRYCSVTLIDAAGDRFASVGARAHDFGADLVLAGPRWRGELSGGVSARRAPSDVVWVVSRIVARSPADMPMVEALAARQWLLPLGEARGAASGDALPSLPEADFPAARHIAMLPPETFLHRMQLLVERAPAAAQKELSREIGPRIARIGPAESWTEEMRQALSRGFADAWAAILAEAEASETAAPGEWLQLGAPLSAAPTVVARAAHALSSLGAPAPEDVLDLSCSADESGRALVGEELYRIRFAPSAAPPAQAAWRLTASPLPCGEAPGVLGDHSDLGLKRDGALELLISAEPPGPGRTVNWLAAPHGAFRLAMRLYWPAVSALGGTWRMAPVERLGSRFGAAGRARPPAAKATGRHRHRMGPS